MEGNVMHTEDQQPAQNRRWIDAAEVARLVGAKQLASGWWETRCPSHDDHTPSCNFRDDVYKDGSRYVRFVCHAGCSPKAVAEAMASRVGCKVADFFERRDDTVKKDHPAGRRDERSKQTPLTVDELAAAKGLPADFLRSLGVRDHARGVEIPYFMPDGSRAPRSQLRLALDGERRFEWLGERGGAIEPYVPAKVLYRVEAPSELFTEDQVSAVQHEVVQDEFSHVVHDVSDAGAGRKRLEVVESCLTAARAEGYTFSVEGPSDCWTLFFTSYHATGHAGADTVSRMRADHLAGLRTLYVVEEPDEGGKKFVEGHRKRLRELGWEGTAFAVQMPEGVKDVNVLWLDSGRDWSKFVERLEQAINGGVQIYPDTGGDGAEAKAAFTQATPELGHAHDPKNAGDHDAGVRESQATTLVRLAEVAEKFHDGEGAAYASVELDGHTETWPVKSRGFNLWLRREFYTAEHRAPSAQAMTDSSNLIEAQALFDGQQRAVRLRVARADEAIYVDLCNERWEAVRVTAAGWEVVAKPPVRFRRSPGMLALPTPMRGGSFSDLWRFVNVSAEDRVLYAAAVVMAFNPDGPYPVLSANGSHGSAKSSIGRVLQRLVDPNAGDLRKAPKESRDVSVAANNGWLVAYDNITSIPDWLSDDLCRLSTGAGHGERTYYTNLDETIVKSKRPSVINGITDIITKPDLLDRAVILQCPPIDDERRIPELAFWAEFEAARPAILGAVLDAVSAAMRRLPDVVKETHRLPRMADFALWATAAEEALGFERGAFMEAYAGAIAGGHVLALEASPIAEPIRKLLERANGRWSGTPTALFSAITALADEHARRAHGWPKAPNAMSGDLRRIVANLKAIGISVSFARLSKGEKRSITIEKAIEKVAVDNEGKRPSPSSPAAQSIDMVAKPGDDRDRHPTVTRPVASSPDLQAHDSGAGQGDDPPVAGDDRGPTIVHPSSGGKQSAGDDGDDGDGVFPPLSTESGNGRVARGDDGSKGAALVERAHHDPEQPAVDVAAPKASSTKRATRRKGWIVMDVNDPGQISSAVLDHGGIKPPKPGGYLYGEIRDLPSNWKNDDGLPIEEIAERISQDSGVDVKPDHIIDRLEHNQCERARADARKREEKSEIAIASATDDRVLEELAFRRGMTLDELKRKLQGHADEDDPEEELF
jgi:hypothetical protein